MKFFSALNTAGGAAYRQYGEAGRGNIFQIVAAHQRDFAGVHMLLSGLTYKTRWYALISRTGFH
ncbi:MAG: hypothetical protein R2860_06910 [Desulfobacterales bacterium]